MKKTVQKKMEDDLQSAYDVRPLLENGVRGNTYSGIEREPT